MSNIIIDTHCHPHFNKYDPNREEMILRAQRAGVGMLCVGVDLESSRKEIEIASTHENMWASVGLHPNDIGENSELIILAYAKIISHPKVVAVGEVGLDYYRTPEPEKQGRQREVFKQFIELAITHNKPLIIHCRNAHADMLEILKTYNMKRKTPDSEMLHAPRSMLYGVIHSFTGTYQEAKKYIELGFYIGLNGIITFARQYDETVLRVPINSILLETDAPFLAPAQYRGQRNEPAYIIEVAKKVAELRNILFEEVCNQTTQNARTLFHL